MSTSKQEAGRMGGKKSAIISKNLKFERINEYNKNPNLCGYCKLPLPYEKRHNKFHDRICAATLNGSLFPRRKKKIKEVKISRAEILMKRFEIGDISERFTLKKVLIQLHGRKCSICNNTHWMNVEIPIEVDHIDGNAGNNMPSNLRLLCPNCHAQTPTAKGKNKGNGRKLRGLRLN
jgi:5-methylcytosine-specific restriction endonuclease McrA